MKSVSAAANRRARAARNVSDKRRANLAKRRAMGLALIERPLRLIHSHHPDLRNLKGHVIGHHPVYARALKAARDGDGQAVRDQARAVLA